MLRVLVTVGEGVDSLLDDAQNAVGGGLGGPARAAGGVVFADQGAPSVPLRGRFGAERAAQPAGVRRRR
ncbi:hypothetical protein M5362_02680 [Streptomyces sp. Je 1-79]|uniref:hypothetical protein n=1 Tax=Streptomyces sp. Je 1-79 TaxID=2943847 RepID=UPI0021A86ED6|nr:hypothetical protein [Streptomyces sp. Je 1-79]MCT4352041.1 hypothetical protein [Streptomyces sp. Je 1-79]